MGECVCARMFALSRLVRRVSHSEFKYHIQLLLLHPNNYVPTLTFDVSDQLPPISQALRLST